jgi:hypothetical protein
MLPSHFFRCGWHRTEPFKKHHHVFSLIEKWSVKETTYIPQFNRRKGLYELEKVGIVHISVRNYLGGALSGPKRPIFRHTSRIFLTVALLRPTKIRFV